MPPFTHLPVKLVTIQGAESNDICHPFILRERKRNVERHPIPD